MSKTFIFDSIGMGKSAIVKKHCEDNNVPMVELKKPRMTKKRRAELLGYPKFYKIEPAAHKSIQNPEVSIKLSKPAKWCWCIFGCEDCRGEK